MNINLRSSSETPWNVCLHSGSGQGFARVSLLVSCRIGGFVMLELPSNFPGDLKLLLPSLDGRLLHQEVFALSLEISGPCRYRIGIPAALHMQLA